MSDNPNTPNRSTYVRETEKKSGSGMALIVGGLVVAVGIILWLVFGGATPQVATPDSPDTTTNVTVETPAADPAPAAPAPADPAPAAPVDTAPAAPAETAPAAPAAPAN